MKSRKSNGLSVLSKNEIIAKGKEVIKIEASAVSNLEKSIDENFYKVVEAIYKSIGRVVLSGMGKSGLIARKIVATLNSTGTASIYLHPTDALHGDLGMVRKEDVIILISKSGNTEEIINLTPMLKRLGVLMIAITSDKNSQLAKECDITLDINVQEEACPYDLAPTASSTATLALGDALSIALLETRGFTKEDFAMLHPGGSLGKRLSLKITEIMYRDNDVPIVNKNASLKDAIFEISSKRLGATGVVDDSGVLIGIITDGDIRRLLERTNDFANLVAENIMTKGPKTIKGEYLASFALQRMEKYKITSLLVTDEADKPVGIVHLHDLVKLGLQRR